MLKQKANANEAEMALTNQVTITAVDSENSRFSELSTGLAEIRKLKGVLGYILRSDSSAIIDFPESDKIIENATLSYQIHESCLAIEKQFNLGGLESVLVEGENVKVLCISVGENKISVFMEKNVTHSRIIKRILM